MPGIKVKGQDPTSPVKKWAEDRSVFDPLYEQIAKRVVGTGMTGLEKLMGDGTDPSFMMNPMNVAVAAVKPAHIPFLKARGAEMIKRIKEVGLARKENFEPIHIDVPNTGQLPDNFFDWSQHSGPEPNIKLEGDPIYERIMQALEFGQRKYKRLVGHVFDIEDVDKAVQDAAGKRGQAVLGASVGASPGQAAPGLDTNKISFLEFDPEAIRRKALETFTDPAETVGHELLHTADRITMGDSVPTIKGNPSQRELYEFANTLPGGYDVNSQEIRAREQGKKFLKKFQEDLLKRGELMALPVGGRKVPIK